jgi:TM2 domain-containing membrane protein YozV
MASQKKPLVALILSLVLPGLGQAYNREVVKGIIIAGACLALAAGSLWLSGIWQLSAALALLVLWVSAILDGYKTAKLLGQPLDWYYRVSYVVTMLLLVGPLALPLLWRSPYFSRRARWIWAVVVILNLLLLLPMAYLLRWLRQKISGAI